MRRLPPLAAVRAFEAAARTENFTAAAAELGMTQAAVSYQVKSLEERLGAPLFVREKGRARLTPLGARLLPPLSERLRCDRSGVRQPSEEDELLLTITTTHTFANTWLAWRLGGFQMEHPDLAVRMTTSNEICDLGRGDADVAIRAGNGGWEGLGASAAVRIRASRRWRARNSLPRSSASSAARSSRATCPTRPDQPQRRLVAAMVFRQWRAGGRSGAAPCRHSPREPGQ